MDFEQADKELGRPVLKSPERAPHGEWLKNEIASLKQEIGTIEANRHPDIPFDAQTMERLRTLNQKLAQLVLDQENG